MAGEDRDQMAAEERARSVGWEHAVRALTGCSIEDARRLYNTPRALQDWLAEDRRAHYERARAQAVALCEEEATRWEGVGDKGPADAAAICAAVIAAMRPESGE